MRSHGLLIAALGVAGLAACTPEVAPVAPERLLAMIPSGEPLLSCRADCLAAWRAAEPQAEMLAAARRWADLALLVLRVNYEDDLTVYYLAEAAQGMGYPTAAAGYYRQSVELSAGPASCATYSGMCGGVSLPRAALARLAAFGRAVPRRAPPPPPGEKPELKVDEPPAPPPPPTVAPPSTMEPPPAPPASPVRAPSREEEQFIEPPPARP
jgi:hypothetical protein